MTKVIIGESIFLRSQGEVIVSLEHNKICEIYHAMVSFLKKLNLPEAANDAEWILCELLGIDRIKFWQSFRQEFPSRHSLAFKQILGRLLKDEPLPYILGKAWFLGEKWHIKQGVLIPRIETEELIAKALCLTAQDVHNGCHVADIGTGSGIIAITLAKQCPNWQVWAIDISPLAIDVAQNNIKSKNAQKNIKLLQGNLLEPIPKHINLRLIVANLPYINDDMLPDLPYAVSAYEPHQALFGGSDGLDLYRSLFNEWLARKPIPPWCLICEFSPEQRAKLLQLINVVFPYANKNIYQDLSGRDRIAAIWQ